MVARSQFSFLASVVALALQLLPSNSLAEQLFDSKDVLELRIEAPLTTLVKVRSDTEYLDGELSYTDETGEVRSFDLKLRARGRYRRLKKTCDFPPIRLNFRTGQVAGSVFEGQDKLKLVTHCRDKSTKNEQYVLREYLAYQILQILTDNSFGARLLRVTYVNTESDKEPLVKYGFAIEHKDSIAERTGMSVLQSSGLTYRDMDEKSANLINLFQYLIGNTDFSLIRGANDDDCCHNSIPFRNGDAVVPIPYDFDFSGMVNADYADPNPRLGLDDVRTRLYRGKCSNNEHLQDSIDYVLSMKPEIFASLDNIPDLQKKHRLEMLRYLNMFFRDISDKKRVRRKLIIVCS